MDGNVRLEDDLVAANKVGRALGVWEVNDVTRLLLLVLECDNDCNLSLRSPFPCGCGEHANDACIVVVSMPQTEHTNYETMKRRKFGQRVKDYDPQFAVQISAEFCVATRAALCLSS